MLECISHTPMHRGTLRPGAWIALFSLCWIVHSQTQVSVGYTLLTVDSGSLAPVGSALFAYTIGGTVVSQAGVAAAEPMLRGRIFVDQAGTQTAIALANPSLRSASLTTIVRDPSGKEVARGSGSLGAGRHSAQFVSEMFPDLPADFTGSLTFESTEGLAAVTLRETRNARNEPVYSTLPVVDLAPAPGAETLVFPQVAAGGGYYTQIVLINASDLPVTGQIRFTDSSGSPLSLLLENSSSAQFSYRIEAQGILRATFDRPSGLATGYALVTPDSGSTSPAGTAVFQYVQKGALVTEAGVAAAKSTSSARLYVDNADAYSGVAIANSSDQPQEVTFTLLDRWGTPEESTTKTLPARGHLATFVHELFPSRGVGYTALMEITASAGVAAVSLKLIVNDRGDLILTTLPVADLTKPPSATMLVFPHVAIGEGFSTRLILIHTEKSRRATGTIQFVQSDGSPMTVPLAGKTTSQLAYEIVAGGGRQFLPGNEAKVSKISILDPVSDRVTAEVAVNEGMAVRPRLLVLDTTGAYRDDFDPTFTSLSTEVATVDGSGSIEGKKAGFSTLTISSDGVVTAATVTVVTVQSGTTGYAVTGIAQDLGSRLYLTHSTEHTILRADDIKATPSLYAGVRRASGLKNDVRLESWFQKPAFITYNQTEGSLYVADAANHVIRRVHAGPVGKVETLAGTGTAGMRDGTAAEATFRDPQGVVLDNRGYLWVVDSGNHTIRRIDLANGTVETLAGKAGSTGSADGTGEQARFNAPVGIAIESEPLAERLERERRGEPPPPVRMIVADTGNGIIRRVTESGEVETLRGSESGSIANPGPRRFSADDSAAPLTFRSPTGVAVDPFGNIYVTEPEAGRVRTVLESGAVVSAGQPRSFSSPRAIAVTDSGRVIATDASRTAREIAYGEPQITSISPRQISNKGGDIVAVKGKNFGPRTVVIIGNVRIRGADVQDTETISFRAPALLSGLSTLTVQNRGGIAQKSIMIEPVALDQTPAGSITTVAGGSTFSGEGRKATDAAIGSPRSIALDAAGNLFIADPDNHRVRRVSASTGILTTLAGTGEAGFSGDNGLAILASVSAPRGITVGPSGDIYVSDTGNACVRRIHRGTGIITTVAGTGTMGSSGDDGQASAARLSSPHGLAFDAAGNLFVADTSNNKIRKITAQTGVISTTAGTGPAGSSGDDGPASAAALSAPRSIAIDSDGNLFVADTGNHKIRKIDARTGFITTVAGTGEPAFSGDAGQATRAALNTPTGVAVDISGDLYIGDSGNGRIRKVSLATTIITTVAGPAAPLVAPREIAIDPSGNLFVADSALRRVQKIVLATGLSRTVAGNGESGFAGDGGLAIAASIGPREIAADARSLFIADASNHRVRKVDGQTGIITTLAGNGTAAFSGDNESATTASLNGPEGVALDRLGNVLISDTDNHRVRMVDVATGRITTVAGNGRSGFSGDREPATVASLSSPRGIAVDLLGNVFVADAFNHRIRKVDAASGIISTAAGNGTGGFSGDAQAATVAMLNSPRSVAVDRAGNLIVADTLNHRIRRVDAETGVIRTIAGNGEKGATGDNGPATAASLNEPRDVCLDADGNIFIADTFNLRIRRVDAKTGIITSVAGGGSLGRPGDNGKATEAALRIARAVAIDGAGTLFIAEPGLSRIRAVRGPLP